MFVKAMVSECDMTRTKYDREVEGAHIISRSAAGRHTCVLYACLLYTSPSPRD